MAVVSPFVPFLCTLWEPCARFFNRYSAFTDQKKKKKGKITWISCFRVICGSREFFLFFITFLLFVSRLHITLGVWNIKMH